jgi:hypothetical protein
MPGAPSCRAQGARVPMLKAAIGIVVLLLVTFAHPIEGNTLGFCPIFKSPLHAANDVVVAAIDISAVWLIYRGFRPSA